MSTTYPQDMMGPDKGSEELSVSFGYRCNNQQSETSVPSCEIEISAEIKIQDPNLGPKSSSFSCLSGAAIGANATLANTNICHGLFGEEILPGLDSPKTFRRLSSSSSSSFLGLEYSYSSSSVSMTAGNSPWSDLPENSGGTFAARSVPTGAETNSFLKALDVQMAGGAAGEDRVQAVCSEENGWLFCGVYDGFNGRDAADFLAGTLYENIGFYLHLLDWRLKQQEHCSAGASGGMDKHEMLQNCKENNQLLPTEENNTSSSSNREECSNSSLLLSCNSYRNGILKCLQLALSQAESDFMYMVEQEMENRPDLVTVGSCVLVVFLHGQDLYTLSLGDSRAILATCDPAAQTSCNISLKAVQLTEIHTVSEEKERTRILNEHLDDPLTIVGDRVKGKLKLTRAFGVGYLKKSNMNDMLMGILRVFNLSSPPYVSTNPSVNVHRISEHDSFVVLGSDGLFDFFSNDEVVQLVASFIINNITGDPAKYIIGQLMVKAAENAGMSIEQLVSIPVGRRRKYHDDVTVIVIMLGKSHSTSTASVSL
eukprot:TRINITY_DN1573_c0_g1_i8.p1 TRINITY_DN1573_c0_g1~~TRINITY_DN1573_c0_g1_i8.p1  ORF type:complete len:540 (+),score=136.96 TRINITY_DN1573_c0_g1_i8:690-2309(+)